MVAAVNQQEKAARWQLRRRLRKIFRSRRIRKEDAKILQEADDDATLETLSLLPRTLSDALPEDPEARANDTRAMVVTECTGTFNMIGCNKAWENLCGYAESEIVGKDSSILQGPESNNVGELSDIHSHAHVQSMLQNKFNLDSIIILESTQVFVMPFKGSLKTRNLSGASRQIIGRMDQGSKT